MTMIKADAECCEGGPLVQSHILGLPESWCGFSSEPRVERRAGVGRVGASWRHGLYGGHRWFSGYGALLLKIQISAVGLFDRFSIRKFICVAINDDHISEIGAEPNGRVGYLFPGCKEKVFTACWDVRTIDALYCGIGGTVRPFGWKPEERWGISVKISRGGATCLAVPQRWLSH